MLKEYNIPETPNSAYNLSSNGLAERHVGVVKLLLKKCVDSGQDFRSALAALNSTARHDGYSPSDKIYPLSLSHVFLYFGNVENNLGGWRLT